VVVPVYNTMPYLTACLDSLVRQSIGPERMQVVAVDDGSTDGSGEELERYAAAHPGLFTVVHQENSGGPAAPCNVGLDLATGRYVFFLGADDYLADRALEDLVDRADEWGSDVIFGRMVGVGGRFVSQRLFKTTDPDLAFPESELPFALANTKLFRRDLLEANRIRYALDLRVGSDQPFTIAAMLHAKRISVLADYPYYFAVRREDAANISFSVDWRVRLEDIGHVMDHVADLVPAGADRDAILRRHFAWELNTRLSQDFPALDPAEQQAMAGVVAGLANRYLTTGLARRLPVAARARVMAAQLGRVDVLRAMAELHADEDAVAPMALAGEKVYLAYPGFRDLPDACFEAVVESLRARGEDAIRATAVHWSGSALVVEGQSLLHPDSAEHVRLALVLLEDGKRPKPMRRLRREQVAEKQGTALRFPVTLTAAAGGATVTARAELGPLLGETIPPDHRWAVRWEVDDRDRSYDLPVEHVRGARTEARVGRRFLDLVARRSKDGRMMVVWHEVPVGEAVRRRLPGRS
jgi:glycosyltransferase involved in cell wall biosynthesis